MKKEQIKKYILELDRLKKYFEGRNYFTQNEIIDWIADCTVVFTDIGVNESVISKFLEFFSIKSKRIEFEDDNLMYSMRMKKEPKDYLVIQTIGSFEQKVEKYNSFGSRRATDEYILSNGLYYARIAYSTANSILKRKADEERLVPRWLLNIFSQNEKFSNLLSSLELIESNYQDSDADGVLKNSLSLLDSLLECDPLLKNKSNLGGRLQCLVDNQSCRDGYGISRDLACALNNSKVIRNEQSAHKSELPMKYDIPFLVVVSFAYLTIYFLEVAVASGKIIKE